MRNWISYKCLSKLGGIYESDEVLMFVSRKKMSSNAVISQGSNELIVQVNEQNSEYNWSFLETNIEVSWDLFALLQYGLLCEFVQTYVMIDNL